MNRKHGVQLYAGLWIIVTLFLLVLFCQNIGDARDINNSGLIRGETQKLVNEELEGHPHDSEITEIDQLIEELKNRNGLFYLSRNIDKDFQNQLSELESLWEEIKQEIQVVRQNPGTTERLYELSQEHFVVANDLVKSIEEDSEGKLRLSIIAYIICMFLSILIFIVNTKKNRRRIKESISTDGLTKLLSRQGFEEVAKTTLERAHNKKYVLIEFDIINFKNVNSAFGHDQGDHLLKCIAKTIDSWKKDGEICGRINADDFILLCEKRKSIIIDLEERLLEEMREEKDFAIFSTVRFIFGAYEIEDNSEPIKTIMDKVNTAHKMAKQSEKHHAIWYDQELIEQLEREKQYIDRIGQGLLANEFKMFLQMKVDLSSLKIMGAEALVRWDLPGRGLVFPDEFIPLFEKSNLIMGLDYYMLEKVCEYQRERLDQGQELFPLSVNFSRVTMYHKNFHNTVIETVKRYGLTPSAIEVEVTETAFNEVADRVLSALRQLADAGFCISMDDFGAGYSNLNMFGRLPIQVIKLDRAFMIEVDSNENTKGIIASVIDIAHVMGIQVICEGVEREEHVRMLRSMGCDYAQGYFFSKPVTQDEFDQMYQSYHVPEELSDMLTDKEE